MWNWLHVKHMWNISSIEGIFYFLMHWITEFVGIPVCNIPGRPIDLSKFTSGFLVNKSHRPIFYDAIMNSKPGTRRLVLFMETSCILCPHFGTRLFICAKSKHGRLIVQVAMFTKLTFVPGAITGKNKRNKIEREADDKKKENLWGNQKDHVFAKTLAHWPCMVEAWQQIK